MRTQHLSIVLLLLLTLSLSSCVNYYISVDSLKEQFAGIDSSKLQKVEIGGSYTFLGENPYWANPIKTIYCTDKDGKPAQLVNGPSIEMRVTYGPDNHKSVFYFDRVMIVDSNLVGGESRFFSSLKKVIPLKYITKIEVQDGHKNYYYVKRN